jgi:hypothetical protein
VDRSSILRASTNDMTGAALCENRPMDSDSTTAEAQSNGVGLVPSLLTLALVWAITAQVLGQLVGGAGFLVLMASPGTAAADASSGAFWAALMVVLLVLTSCAAFACVYVLCRFVRMDPRGWPAVPLIELAALALSALAGVILGGTGPGSWLSIIGTPVYVERLVVAAAAAPGAWYGAGRAMKMRETARPALPGCPRVDESA